MLTSNNLAKNDKYLKASQKEKKRIQDSSRLSINNHAYKIGIYKP